MEKIILKRIEHHIESRNTYPATQTGYCCGRSTTDLLAVLTHIIRQAKTGGKYSLVVFLDVQGALDCVWLHGPLYKMKPQLIRWIYHYLKNRRTSVQIFNCLPERQILSRGLPQGAVLSTLFNIMMSDLPKSQLLIVLSYADNITLAVVSDSGSCSADYAALFRFTGHLA
jgi:hypothetical protein